MSGAHTLIDRRGDGVDDITIAAEAVNSKAARALYKKRTPIYPKLGSGRYRTIKWVVMAALLAIYYGTPWLRWDRGPGAPDQAVLIDFAKGRFYFFFIELWPQEIYFITGILIVAAVGIFLSSALFGRVWCGYACPQTVWTDLFLHVERWIEGDRAARMRLARAPMSVSKVTRKVTKHALWLLVAAATGGAWVFYFADAPTLARQIFFGHASTVTYLSIGLLTFTTYALAGTMREQVCTYMCPWPRIQAAMTDKDALSVTYLTGRGEPRGSHKKGDPWEGRGDCIDCRQCVAVCPQGIDIRDGDQLECINCALCIDACDAVMDKVGRPRGLIAYDSYENEARRASGRPTALKLIRPRTVLYGLILVAVSGVMLYALLTRTTLSLDAMRDRNPPFVRLGDGGVRNGYTIRVINKAAQPRGVRLRIAGLPHARLRAMQAGSGADDTIDFSVGADQVTTLRVYVIADMAAGTRQFAFSLTDPASGEAARRSVAFVSGAAP